MGDAWALNVAGVIGPPYAVLRVQPAIGPITGGQDLEVIGEGFEVGSGATVRFISGKKFVEAAGTCASATTIAVPTPSYEHVRISSACTLVSAMILVQLISSRSSAVRPWRSRRSRLDARPTLHDHDQAIHVLLRD